MLGLAALVVMSGCPGEAGNSGHYPNWITTTWQPEYPELLEWQWRSAVIPFWTEMASHLSAVVNNLLGGGEHIARPLLFFFY
ncbi:MAG: hypothetical protein IT331_12955 [Anaerolineae bacterium]|nr:hypothetical protein [Anaerolineae bacterium]